MKNRFNKKKEDDMKKQDSDMKLVIKGKEPEQKAPDIVEIKPSINSLGGAITLSVGFGFLMVAFVKLFERYDALVNRWIDEHPKVSV